MNGGVREELAAALGGLAADRGSGGLRILSPHGRIGTLWLREGRVVDCEAEGRVGEAAFHRLMRWREGALVALPGARSRVERIRRTTRELVAEAERRSDAWERLVERLPSLDRPLQIDYLLLSDRLGDVPDELNALLRLVDGRRTVEEVVEGAPGDLLEAAAAVIRLVSEGLLRTTPREPSHPHTAAGPDLDPPRIVHFPVPEKAARAPVERIAPARPKERLDGPAGGRLPPLPADDDITLLAPLDGPATLGAPAARAPVPPGELLSPTAGGAPRPRRAMPLLTLAAALLMLGALALGLWGLGKRLAGEPERPGGRPAAVEEGSRRGAAAR